MRRQKGNDFQDLSVASQISRNSSSCENSWITFILKTDNYFNISISCSWCFFILLLSFSFVISYRVEPWLSYTICHTLLDDLISNQAKNHLINSELYFTTSCWLNWLQLILAHWNAAVSLERYIGCHSPKKILSCC